jgi:hypothetical protein
VQPNAANVSAALGGTSETFSASLASLAEQWSKGEGNQSLRLNRELWARSLHLAFGDGYTTTDDLFFRHTYLGVTAVLVAHAACNRDITEDPERLLVDPHLDIENASLFGWVAEVAGSGPLVESIAAQVRRFDWSSADQDVMKALHHSVINADTRRALGEYYTPDWLASAVVDAVVTDPANQRVLDPSCGSGTFLFHAVQRHCAAVRAGGATAEEAALSATRHVFGIDLHPVSAMLAQVTYLLALGAQPSVAIPVWQGDSMQWGSTEGLVVQSE